jgi:hypothetical protein
MQRHSPPSDAPLRMIQLLLACKAPNCLKGKSILRTNAAMILYSRLQNRFRSHCGTCNRRLKLSTKINEQRSTFTEEVVQGHDRHRKIEIIDLLTATVPAL